MNGISVVIPAYNEEDRLGDTLSKIKLYLDKNHDRYEIIVVDDGSLDCTVDVANDHDAILIKNDSNKGKGYSLRQGLSAARYDLILFSDADLSTPIDELKKLIRYIKKHDIVIGSRNMSGSDIQIRQPFIRSTLGKIFPFFVNLIVIDRIKDTQCGFKLLKKNVVDRLIPHMKTDGFTFDVELLYLAKKEGFKIKEVPVRWLNDKKSKVSVIADPVKMFMSLFRIRFS
ncbi:glycosyl transferase [Candidatus Woesearchaeota archaeon CG11_big_fil_rev_8_21_14_0_20_43_8]|nr:MAG: glycosyl transferase [Candidatus Woesearchaeota archaeon CG11_big_fil_rev_8_21_14_0_20_43_8]PIO06708.1 MAG: glycosyl transferase [Candidatus Woesearchaeota archaeon CG08_land_8_20_14_0_20_43_7]